MMGPRWILARWRRHVAQSGADVTAWAFVFDHAPLRRFGGAMPSGLAISAASSALQEAAGLDYFLGSDDTIHVIEAIDRALVLIRRAEGLEK